MAKLTTSELRAILAAEKAEALAAVSATKLSQDRADALDYYNGDMPDVPATTGRSSVVSSDVSDTVEGLMPGLMEIFAGGDQDVQFAPVGPEDVAQAEQETDYVNHVFMQQNPGFMVLYTMVKDALLSKVGIVKIWTEEEEEIEERKYVGQSPDVLALLSSDPEIEVVESVDNNGLFDIAVQTRGVRKCHKVEPVPPEEFGICRDARSIKDATYCFHECKRAVGDLIDEGYDADQVMALPSDTEFGDNAELRSRDTVDESTSNVNHDTINKARRLVTVTEHYIRMDYEGKGGDDVYKVVTGGSQSEVLLKDGKPDIEQVDYAPFAGMTPIPMPHRFFGRSIADLVMDIQRIKTALLRGALDNLYLHNNPRVEVAQSHANDQTLDDLLVVRPGGVVRTKQPGGIAWQVVPDITASIYPALEYFDQTREWKTGVTRQGQGIDADALQNQSATAVNHVMAATQARQKMIARIFAETGIRDMFAMLHAEIRKHGDVRETVRLRNQWIPVDPRQWKNRKDMTINVGLGSGNKSERVMHLMALINLQKEAVAAGKTNLVTDSKLYNAAKELCKLLDYKDPEEFFADPDAKDQQGNLINPPPQPQPSPEMMKIQVDAQMKQADMQMRAQELQVKAQIDQVSDQRKAEIEQVQAQADIATQDRKTEAEMALAKQRFELERELKMLDYQLKRESQAAELVMKREIHNQQLESGAFKQAASMQSHEMKMQQAEARPER